MHLNKKKKGKVSSSFCLPFSPISSYQVLTNVKGAAALKAVAPFMANPKINFFFFLGGGHGKGNIMCDFFMLVCGLGFIRASLQHFQLGASCPVTQLHRQGGCESDQGTDPVYKLCTAVYKPCSLCPVSRRLAPFPCRALLPSGGGMALSLRYPFNQGHVFLLLSLQRHRCLPDCTVSKFREPKWPENKNVVFWPAVFCELGVLEEGWWLTRGGNAWAGPGSLDMEYFKWGEEGQGWGTGGCLGVLLANSAHPSPLGGEEMAQMMCEITAIAIAVPEYIDFD